MVEEQYDYVITGAGSAGAVLAARLSENPSVTVCLLEAGGKDNNPFIHVPFGLSLLSRFDSIGWGYFTAPQRELNDRELFWPRGKTLGGSSSVNAMCYIRGQREDYDRWAESGAAGWSYNEVLPWFKKAEDYHGGADAYHGTGGPLRVEKLRHTDPLSRRFVNSADAAGLPVRTDFNREQREGLGFYDVTQKHGRRWSTAQAYLKPALNRPNLTVHTRTLTEKVLFTGKTASGVQVRYKGKGRRIGARKEVILCGGAINSPHLLMLSGVGPRDMLMEKGIHVVADSPGTGRNLQDHLDAIVQYRCTSRQGYAVALSAIPSYIAAGFRYLFSSGGLLSSNIAEAGGFASSSLSQSGQPDLQFHFLPAILAEHGRRSVYGYGFGVHVCALYPKSRGSISLQSSHPADHPLIEPAYLTHPDDKKVLLEGVALADKLVNSTAFDDVRGKRLSPPQGNNDEALLDEFIREHAESIYHPVGTCKMGAADDEMAVTDNQCRVKGVNGLRVADASVMPVLPGGNTNAPVVMIAERVADLIIRSAGHP